VGNETGYRGEPEKDYQASDDERRGKAGGTSASARNSRTLSLLFNLCCLVGMGLPVLSGVPA